MKYIDFLLKKRYSRNVVIPALKKLGFENKAQKLEECGNFKRLAVCKKCGCIHYNGANSCKDRFCPVCQKKRALLWILKVYPIFEDLISRGYIVNFITLTVPDGDNLKERLNILNNSFRYMLHENSKSRYSFNNIYLGGIRSLEVKKGRFSNLWHPHLHMLVVKKIKTDFREDRKLLTEAWANALTKTTGIYHSPQKVIIDIKSLYLVDKITGQKKYSKFAILKACLEVFKYLVKSNFEELACKELIKTMSSIRGINPWGNVRYLLHDKNIELTIEHELDMSENELSDKVCAICGNDDFIQIKNVGVYGQKIYDLKNKKTEVN